MDTLARPEDNPADRETAPPYFSRRAALDAAAAERGLPPEPWAA